MLPEITQGTVMIRNFALAFAVTMTMTACADKGDEGAAKANEVVSSEAVNAEFPDPRADHVEDRFALMALSCVAREYPNKISHVLTNADDVRAPHELFPAFYGCFDWHSSVHGHWLMARILKTDPESPMVPAIKVALSNSLTDENIAGEVAYYNAANRASFERPYGIAWLLQLVAELEEGDDPEMTVWRESLRPLEDAIVEKTMAWLPKLSYPIRLGTHNQSAFAFGLMLDYARTVDNEDFAVMLEDKIRGFHMRDVNCPIAYEPSGEGEFLYLWVEKRDVLLQEWVN